VTLKKDLSNKAMRVENLSGGKGLVDVVPPKVNGLAWKE
jgi:hypothetical protein